MRRLILCALCAPMLLVSLLLLLFAAAPVSAQDADPLDTRSALAPSQTPTATVHTVWSPMVSRNTALADGLEVTPVLDNARAVTKIIPPTGGVIEATSAKGDRYILVFSDGALLVTTTVTLTPVTQLQDLPRGGFAAGVQIAPNMLTLWQDATLRIIPAQEIPVPQQDSFAWFGAGEDFHLYPLEVTDKRIEFAVMRLHGYGVGRLPSAAGADASAASIEQAPLWMPHDILAGIAQRVQPIIQQLREDMHAGRPSDPALTAQIVSLLREMWTRAIQPLLAPMTTSCDAMKQYLPIVRGWTQQTAFVDGDESFPEETAQIAAAVAAALENCIREAAEPCYLPQDTEQVDEILGYARQLALVDESRVPNLNELPKCQEIDVTLGGSHGVYFPMQPDPESGWHSKAYYDFTDANVAGVLVSNPVNQLNSGVRGEVRLRGRFGDTWRDLAFSDLWLCRDRADERIDGLIVELGELEGEMPVPFELLASSLGCWRWQIQQDYTETYTANPEITWTRDWQLGTTLEVANTLEPMAAWNSFAGEMMIIGNPLEFRLAGNGTFTYDESYTWVGESSSCQTQLSAQKSPPEDENPSFPGKFVLDIDPKSEHHAQMRGSLQIAIDQDYQGDCAAFTHRQGENVSSSGKEVAANGHTSTGANSGLLGEGSGNWDLHWTYTAQKE